MLRGATLRARITVMPRRIALAASEHFPIGERRNHRLFRVEQSLRVRRHDVGDPPNV